MTSADVEAATRAIVSDSVGGTCTAFGANDVDAMGIMVSSCVGDAGTPSGDAGAPFGAGCTDESGNTVFISVGVEDMRSDACAFLLCLAFLTPPA